MLHNDVDMCLVCIVIIRSSSIYDLISHRVEAIYPVHDPLALQDSRVHSLVQYAMKVYKTSLNNKFLKGCSSPTSCTFVHKGRGRIFVATGSDFPIIYIHF